MLCDLEDGVNDILRGNQNKKFMKPHMIIVNKKLLSFICEMLLLYYVNPNKFPYNLDNCGLPCFTDFKKK